MRHLSKKLEETKKFAKDLTAKLENDQSGRNQATLVCLFGNLGAGKTAWVKASAEYLGVKEDVTSPTFVILKNYDLGEGAFRRLIHIDAYRLESAKELLNLGWDEIIADKDNIIFLEWPEKVAEILPLTSVKIYLKHGGENQREIEIVYVERFKKR